MPLAQREHNERLLAAHIRRLQALEVKAAEFGIDTPAEVENEITEIKREIAQLSATVEAITTLDALTPSNISTNYDRRSDAEAQRTRTMIATVQPIVGAISNTQHGITGEIAMFRGEIRDDVQSLEESTRREIIEIRREVKGDLKDARDQLERTAKAIENLVVREIRDVRRIMFRVIVVLIVWEILTRGVDIALMVMRQNSG